MLYVPQYYFSFFGMMTYSVATRLHGIACAARQLNRLFCDREKIELIAIHLNAIVQTKIK
ncbi:MAG: hypothetical protein JXQ76_12680 [Campylobacterales bacterium]|nr:hypothetical protein [Campylobacterales bacterium]